MKLKDCDDHGYEFKCPVCGVLMVRFPCWRCNKT